MKKCYLVIGALTLCSAIYAQTEYDITPIMSTELNGTARFVGMGGAMGALGGDITTMGTNPAGIGIYRSNDVAVTAGYNYMETKGRFNGTSDKADCSRMSFDQIGFVISSKVGNNTALRFVNFGFTYRKANNFNNRLAVQGNLNGSSQTGYMANQAYNSGASFSSFDSMLGQSDYSAYGDVNFGWLTVMGGRTGMVDATQTTYPDGSTEESFDGWDGQYAHYRSRTKGGVDVYDFNISFNIEDRFYFGVTIGAYDVSYTRYSIYGEDVMRAGSSVGELYGSYSLEHWYKTTGSGIDAKFGVIVRPFESLPLRIGLAVHTPTWYSLTEKYSARMRSEFEVENSSGGVDTSGAETDSYYGWGGNVVNDYELTTPWKLNVSAGYTIDNSVALGAEYEYADYSSAKLRDAHGHEDSYMRWQNGMIDEDLKGVHTLRLGMEARLVPQLSLRLGYNYSSAMYEEDAYKELAVNTTRTDTQYANGYETNTYTVGLGYKYDRFYADVAYLYNTQKADLYFFDDLSLRAAKMKYNKNRLLLTLGMRF